MTVTLTYDTALSRVRVTATGLNAADTATVERSTNGLQWTTVRGGAAVPVTSGTMTLTVDDYEFVDGVSNTYRVRGVAAAAAAFVNASSTSGNNTALTAALPSGTAADDLVLIVASIRNSGTGVPNLPASWSTLLSAGNVAVFGRIYDGVWTMPSVSFTGGVANADTIVQAATFRRTSVSPVTSTSQLNASAQNIAYPALSVPQAGCVVVAAGWKQDDWTGISVPAGFTHAGAQVSTAGDDAGQTLDYQVQTTAVSLTTGSWSVTGGAAAISRALLVVLGHAAYINEQTAVITPQLGAVWLKDIGRPFLNRPVSVVMPDENIVTRDARDGVFAIVGRSAPIAVTDVRGPRAWPLLIQCHSTAEADAVDLMLSTGDPMFVHVPAGCQVPGGYVRIGNTSQAWHPLRPEQSLFTLPVSNVAAPGPDVVGTTATWQTVLNLYATWSAVIAANATWADLLNLVGSPSEVIVP